jgi:hypothetical protein
VCAPVLVVILISSPIVGDPIAGWGTKRHEKKLQRPELYQSVATNLALYTQTFRPFLVPGFVKLGGLGAGRLPHPLDQLDVSYASFQPTGINVEFGGGFHHYGYHLVQEENSFVLHFYSERQRDPKRLLQINLSSDAKLPIAAFDSRIISNLNSAITNSPNEIGPIQYKIIFLLIYNRDAARLATEKAAADFPENWWPEMMLAILDANGSTRDKAHARFKQWVEDHPHFVHYFFLAFYENAIGLVDDAGISIEKTANQTIRNLRTDFWIIEPRARQAALLALKLKKLDAALTISSNLEKKQFKDYRDQELVALIQAAQSSKAGGNEIVIPPEIFQELNSMDISAYLESPHPTKRPTVLPILLPMLK